MQSYINTLATGAIFMITFLTPLTTAGQDLSSAPRIADPSYTRGLFINARFGGYGIGYEDDHEGTGEGLGLRLGYGFTDRFTAHMGVDIAGLTDHGAFETLEADEKYGMILLDLGGRFHFRHTKRLVPFAEAGLTVVGVGFEDDQSTDGLDTTYGGLGVTLAGGLQYFVSRKFAMEASATFTPGSLMEREIGGAKEEDLGIGMASVRVAAGLVFYPFR